MAGNEKVDISSAFEMLLEEIETQISLTKKTGATAIEKGLYDDAKLSIEQAERITDFRNKISDLRDEWDQHEKELMPDDTQITPSGIEKRNLGRLKRGLRTREEAYFKPILQALTELGGSAKMRDILDKVGKIMQKDLKPVDHDPLPSDPETIRWRNTAQWARHSMVKRDLLKSDSPHGIWEITSKGQKFLNND